MTLNLLANWLIVLKNLLLSVYFSIPRMHAAAPSEERRLGLLDGCGESNRRGGAKLFSAFQIPYYIFPTSSLGLFLLCLLLRSSSILYFKLTAFRSSSYARHVFNSTFPHRESFHSESNEGGDSFNFSYSSTN